MGGGASAEKKKERKGQKNHRNRQTTAVIVSARVRAESGWKAAVLIQRWYRTYLARLEIRRRTSWELFQQIEYCGQQDELKLYGFFCALLGRPESGPSLSPTSPIGHVGLEELVENLKREQPLDGRFVCQILEGGAKALRQLPTLQLVASGGWKEIAVCGDLHGQLQDLLLIFYKNGLPSPDNPYVFNGDYVDRGPCGIEVLVLLLACLLNAPGSVALNRGNHEDHVMNARYGFVREVRRKYKEMSGRILRLVDEVYRSLPLATLIDNQICVVHGGVSASTDLAKLGNIDRVKFLSVLRPPAAESRDHLGKPIRLSDLANLPNSEWRQVVDVLWSDPVSRPGSGQNTFRGGGAFFGPDVSKSFLAKHGLNLLIRSHECKTSGYEFTHNDQVLTIFSASNYYEEGSNRGAYVKLLRKPESPNTLHPIMFQFSSFTPRTRNLPLRHRVGHVEAAALRDLRGRIACYKGELRTAFEAFDPQKTKTLNVKDWAKAMEDILTLRVPWRLLRPSLATVDSDGMVNYESTFDDVDKVPVGVEAVLYRHRAALESLFRKIDVDNSGGLSAEELSEACSGLGIDTEELCDIARSLDVNGDGQVSLNEFLETFRLVSRKEIDE